MVKPLGHSTGKRLWITGYAPFAAAAITLVAALISCSSPENDQASEGLTANGSTITEAEYIDYISALTVALEEGLTGDAADLRISELGVKVLIDGEIELVLDGLRRDPIHWVEIERSIDERTKLMRRNGHRPKNVTDQESER